MAKWSEQQMSDFIHLYETHSCLWNTNSPDYKMRDKRQSALQNIVEEMNIPDFTVNDCKNKIKNVRSHHCQELKKIKNSMKSGMGTDDLYKSTLPWFHILDSFLRAVVTQKTESNLETTQREITQDTETDMATDAEVIVVDESIPTPVNESESINEPSTSKASAMKRPIKSCVNKSTPRSTKMKISNKGSDSDSFLHSAIEKLETISGNARTALKKTEFDIFGESVAAQLNNMNFEHALELQLQIQKLITQERIRIHKNTQVSQYFRDDYSSQTNRDPTDVSRETTTDDSLLSFFDL